MSADPTKFDTQDGTISHYLHQRHSRISHPKEEPPIETRKRMSNSRINTELPHPCEGGCRVNHPPAMLRGLSDLSLSQTPKWRTDLLITYALHPPGQDPGHLQDGIRLVRVAKGPQLADCGP